MASDPRQLFAWIVVDGWIGKEAQPRPTEVIESIQANNVTQGHNNNNDLQAIATESYEATLNPRQNTQYQHEFQRPKTEQPNGA